MSYWYLLYGDKSMYGSSTSSILWNKKKMEENSRTQSNKLSPIHLLGFGSCQADLFQRQNLPRRPEGEKATSATSTLQKTDISWAFLIEQTASTFREQWSLDVSLYFLSSSSLPPSDPMLSLYIYTQSNVEADYILGRRSKARRLCLVS
jgi:hypothetical protein